PNPSFFPPPRGEAGHHPPGRGTGVCPGRSVTRACSHAGDCDSDHGDHHHHHLRPGLPHHSGLPGAGASSLIVHLRGLLLGGARGGLGRGHGQLGDVRLVLLLCHDAGDPVGGDGRLTAPLPALLAQLPHHLRVLRHPALPLGLHHLPHHLAFGPRPERTPPFGPFLLPRPAWPSPGPGPGPGPGSAALATVPGLLKVLEISAHHFAVSAAHPRPWPGWCLAVYCICFILSAVAIILSLGDCTGQLPIPFPTFLTGLAVVAVALYASALVLWPLYQFDDRRGGRSRRREDPSCPYRHAYFVCDWDRRWPLPGVNPALVADLVHSAWLVFIRGVAGGLPSSLPSSPSCPPASPHHPLLLSPRSPILSIVPPPRLLSLSPSAPLPTIPLLYPSPPSPPLLFSLSPLSSPPVPPPFSPFPPCSSPH
uniref:MARVEL domain-containing protein n=1 Tax=Sarcophilus harrisii TaxID=9305 RepID=A0A7N4V5J8_SARHA